MTRAWRLGSERIGIVTGLAAEAQIARHIGCPVAVGGGMVSGARAAARRLAEQGATALISFGLAGGLDPELTPGTLLVPAAILVGGMRLLTDPSLSAWLGDPSPHCLLGAEGIAAGVADKRRLWTRSGCVALDLESGPVAQTATALRLPFAALRAICDPADRGLPAASFAALSAKGRIRPVRVLASLVCEPGQVFALLRLAADATRARRALSDRVASIRTQSSAGRLSTPGEA